MCALHLTACVYTVKRRKCENKMKHSSVLMRHNIKHTQQEGSGESSVVRMNEHSHTYTWHTVSHKYTVHTRMQPNVSVNQNPLINIA